MIISDKFVIGHIPKTGGHALAVMLSKVNSINIEIPFNIKDNRAKIKNEDITLHLPLINISTIKDKDIILVIRKLPYWYYSILWHHNLHTKVNYKCGVHKFKVRNVYDKEFRNAVPQTILLPEITCKTTYPDFKLKEMGGNYLNDKNRIIWFKMENLANDLLNYLKNKEIIVTDKEKKEIVNLHKKHSYNTRTPMLRYFSPSDLDILYKNNPNWYEIECKIYGNRFYLK